MKALTQEQKLHILMRVEPGSMGPAGIDHIQEFCQFAQKGVESLDADFVLWEIKARMNKKLPEMQYKIANKNLTREQADKYVSLFGKCIDEFEDHIHDRIAELVDEFWADDTNRGT